MGPALCWATRSELAVIFRDSMIDLGWKAIDAVDLMYDTVRDARGLRLLRLRGERLKRPFAHLYEMGGMRGVYLRGHANIRKRLLIHTGGFNLELPDAATDRRGHAARAAGAAHHRRCHAVVADPLSVERSDQS